MSEAKPIWPEREPLVPAPLPDEAVEALSEYRKAIHVVSADLDELMESIRLLDELRAKLKEVQDGD